MSVTLPGSDFDWQGRKVLVTGASGFKGSWLCGILSELKAEVYGTIRNRIHPDSPYELLSLHNKIVEVTADISDRQQVYDMINSIEPDVIFHLAAKAIVPISFRDPRRAFEVNIMGTTNLVEACRKMRVRDKPICQHLLICSTDHVFGDVSENDIPIPESRPVSYSGAYDTSKAAMELVVRCYHINYRDELPNICITRCANVFGFGDTAQRRIIPEFILAGLTNRVIPFRTKLNGRQFIHVADAVSGYILAVSKLGNLKAMLPTPTFHFSIDSYKGTSDPRFIRIHELAEVIAKITEATVQPGVKDYADNENPVLGLSCSEARTQLGWEPHRDFVPSLHELAKWYRPGITRERRRELIGEAVEVSASLLRKGK